MLPQKYTEAAIVVMLCTVCLARATSVYYKTTHRADSNLNELENGPKGSGIYKSLGQVRSQDQAKASDYTTVDKKAHLEKDTISNNDGPEVTQIARSSFYMKGVKKAWEFDDMPPPLLFN